MSEFVTLDELVKRLPWHIRVRVPVWRFLIRRGWMKA